MIRALVVAAGIFAALAAPACAHRLDQYLQATIITVEKDRVQAFIRLIPGVAVSSTVISSIDTNADGIISKTEQQAYAQRVLQDLSLSVDGRTLHPRLVSFEFPGIVEIKEGLGEIQIELAAELPRGGVNRSLIFENHHQSGIAAYLVNCLVPPDKSIHMGEQSRNENQSYYRLSYVQARVGPDTSSPQRLSEVGAWLAGLALLLFALLALLRRQRYTSGVAV